ncbi:DNA mismatch repair protein [Pedobacter sp. MC2016-05]|uniref:MutS-related protein n=1 Tax=Pedobacter sp. MC2016-05 TaxID=2994474 RepID=UPI002247ABF9|nr:DNA mismatch repair protein [Pedobacter sp. MC2016-05]MCX2475352.1 DNA mismatch repair protein [Pedobacter sp. MC2016-05]
MSLIVDKQTQDDLNLLGKYTPGSVFSLFNKTKTDGGEQLLLSMFLNPMITAVEINERRDIFRYFEQKDIDFKLERKYFQSAENYLAIESPKMLIVAVLTSFIRKGQSILIRDERYGELVAGLKSTMSVLRYAKELSAVLTDQLHSPFEKEKNTLNEILNNPFLIKLIAPHPNGEFEPYQLALYDQLLKQKLHTSLRKVFEILYAIDVYSTVARLGKIMGCSYADALDKEKNVLKVTGLRHPALKKAVGNDLMFDHDANLLFLTGANMAGKSTIMKSLGIAVYLAHMGFPVAANEIIFSVRDGLYTSINVSDNLQTGYSHFYAEVLRVKNAALQVASGKCFVVLFDELFKGTNVKDAYDATLAVTEAFARYSKTAFIVSTHIIEVGEALKGSNSIKFAYMPTVMSGNKPTYPYKLMPGITSDRQGMIIIENEGILELLKN